ncbi:hypothetical protein BaRGS_00015619 [Batillaria attramentaria]|uniref:Uncharacterized protein n=1 Tax=Batillaria attramentaria TaxID=370345 RepID=A0ABD0L1K1_9CAEN
MADTGFSVYGFEIQREMSNMLHSGTSVQNTSAVNTTPWLCLPLLRASAKNSGFNAAVTFLTFGAGRQNLSKLARHMSTVLDVFLPPCHSRAHFPSSLTAVSCMDDAVPTHGKPYTSHY